MTQGWVAGTLTPHQCAGNHDIAVCPRCREKVCKNCNRAIGPDGQHRPHLHKIGKA